MGRIKSHKIPLRLVRYRARGGGAPFRNPSPGAVGPASRL